MTNFKFEIFICAVVCALFGMDRSCVAQAASGGLLPGLDSPVANLNDDAAQPDEPINACACGCDIFDVGTSSMLPMGKGGMVWFEYAFQDQNINWDGSSRAPAANNPDKEIRTSFMTAGVQYMVSNDWGYQIEIPTAYRHFTTTAMTGDAIVSETWPALGDIRAEGIYTGLFPDMSLGMEFGFKLPTGDYTFNDNAGDVDRDSEIGTGSTDVLLGGFYRRNLDANGNWTAFTQALLDLPFMGRQSYLPGAELDGAIGVYYTGLHIGKVGFTPIAQMLYAWRLQDSGSAAAYPIQSGYTRVLLSPGFEIDMGQFSVNMDAELPVYLHTNGDQLVAPVLLKCIVSYRF